MFVELLGDHAEHDHIHARLQAAERKNLKFYGFGVKGFTLSMIETAIEITEGKVDAKIIAKLLDQGREMLSHPVELLPGAHETLENLHKDYKILLITKGDLIDQQRKVSSSDLSHLFHSVEIVTDKTPETYAAIFKKHGSDPEHGLMAGNSLKSDVIPMLQAGGFGIHVPHELIWDYEHEETPHQHARFFGVKNLVEMVPLVHKLSMND